MSLVGTRPPTVDEWDKYELHHRARLATKPGLTGMWQYIIFSLFSLHYHTFQYIKLIDKNRMIFLLFWKVRGVKFLSEVRIRKIS